MQLFCAFLLSGWGAIFNFQAFKVFVFFLIFLFLILAFFM